MNESAGRAPGRPKPAPSLPSGDRTTYPSDEALS
jgi:hypothetical protein